MSGYIRDTAERRDIRAGGSIRARPTHLEAVRVDGTATKRSLHPQVQLRVRYSAGRSCRATRRSKRRCRRESPQLPHHLVIEIASKADFAGEVRERLLPS